MTRWLGHLAAAAIGAIVGGAIVLGAADLSSEDLPAPTVPDRPLGAAGAPVIGEPPPKTTSRLLLVWTSGGLPASAPTAIRSVEGVRDVTVVRSGVDWLQRAVGPDGAVVTGTSGGRSVPVETAVIDPRQYASFVPPAERDVVLGLGPGEVLLSESEAKLRGSEVGTQLKLEDRDLEVVGILSDTAAQGYELAVAGEPPAAWSRVDSVVLLHIKDLRTRNRVSTKVGSLLRSGQRMRVRARGETPFLRYGDAVLPQAVIKSTFGEFSAVRNSDGSLSIDPRWVAQNIRRARVPILGSVTCHRVLIPQLRDALRQLQDEGLSSTINTRQYGGCYGPRFIDRNPANRISHHAWGIAIDMNVAENAFGTKADQDRRLVEIMEKHGFTWGGRWLVPDGMHFEWARFP